MSKIKISYPIVVEGKYDRQRVLDVADAQVLTTDGFGIFNKKEKLALIRALGKRSPIIVLTDSDGAGKLIRSHITEALPKDRLIQLYIPRIKGKEQRKKDASAEGTLGVEGMELELIKNLLLPFENPDEAQILAQNPLSKTDFFEDGLLGAENSSARRDLIAAKFELPPGMTSNALLAALKAVCTYEEYLNAVGRSR